MSGWDSEEDWDAETVTTSFNKLDVNSETDKQHLSTFASGSSRVPDKISFGRKNHHDYFDGTRSDSQRDRKNDYYDDTRRKNDHYDDTRRKNDYYDDTRRKNDHYDDTRRKNDYYEDTRSNSQRGRRNDYRHDDHQRNEHFEGNYSNTDKQDNRYNENGFQSRSSYQRDYKNNDYGGRASRSNYNSQRQSRDSYQSRDNQQNRRYNNESQESSEITIHSRDCGRIIGKGGSKIRELQEDSGARIKVCKNDGENDQIPVVISGSSEAIEKAKNMIDELIKEADMYRRPISPARNDDDSQASKDQFLSNGTIDWSLVIADAEKRRTEYWSKFPDVIKDFYIEDDDVADMTTSEAARWREKNFNLSVVDFSSEKRPSLNPVLTFEHAFAHYPEILEQIYKQGFVKPSPIQSQVWPLALRGYDVIGIAQTGTGKTLAFLLPIFIHIDKQSIPRNERKGPSALVLTPTRELALQIETEIKKYSYRGIRCVCVYGGGDRKKQIKLVMSGVEIIVATPGRFNDLLDCKIITLENITYLVLDEADRMLDMGFEPQIMKILIDIRPDRQTLMTSATWPSGVRRLAQNYLVDPFQVNVGSLDLAATHTVQQIIEIIEEDDKRDRLYEFIGDMKEEDKVLVFVGKKATCDDLSSDLALRNVICQSIHGGREQYDREQALDDFKTGMVRILVATDVASRGLDVKDITHVLNFDFPRNTEEYVHRVGRTGRAGRFGVSLSLVTRSDWGSAKELIAILEEAQQEVPLELYDMAERFEKMKERRAMDRGAYGGGGRRGGGRGGWGGGGRGFRGGNRW